MSKFRRVFLIFTFILLISFNFVYASEFSDVIEKFEFTDEFKSWMSLTNEEQEKTLQPRSFKILNTSYASNNPIKISQNVGSTLVSRFSLRDYIPENLIIKDQGNIQSCWAFASLASLETNLALRNYYNNSNLKLYDFSERHMIYATTRNFKDGQINSLGVNKTIASGGNYYISRSYLTNGTGPILENDMPYTDDDSLIDISEIQGKQVIAKVKDTITFPEYVSGTSKTEMINKVKEHVKQYGGVEAAIYGAQPLSETYNKVTGANYCNDSKKYDYNHDILIIGWDDNYSRENFNEAMRPQNDGAWIIKNSWGEKVEITFDEAKEVLFNSLTDAEKERYGFLSPSDIPDEIVKAALEDFGYVIDGNKGVITLGEKGFMYVSYEDENIYRMMSAVEKSTDEIDYDYIYQYDYLPAIYTLPLSVSKVYLANVYNKKSSDVEFLNEVSILATETYTCKVYVNPENSSKAYWNLQEVKLKDGNSETFDAGYHTIEFAEPIEITGDQFVVMIEITGTRSNGISIALEAPCDNTIYDCVEIETGKCYWSIDNQYQKNSWADCSGLNSLSNGGAPDSDLTIKAFTTKKSEIVNPDEPINPGNNSKAIPTDFDNAKANVISAKGFYFTDANTKEYTLLEINVDNLSRNLNNDDFEYYYYLSTNSAEKINSQNMIRITESQNSNSKLTFTVDTRKLANYSDLLVGNNLYLYIMEKAIKDDDSVVTITKGLLINNSVKLEVYKDNVKQNDASQGETNNNQGSQSANTQTNENNTTTKKENDDTVANKILPNTGKKIILIICVLSLTVAGVILYKKDKYMNI